MKFAYFTVAAYITMLLFCRDGSAAFVNGVEQFHGTIPDSSTWASSPSGVFFIQNDSLTLPGGGGYTTTSPLVPVGGSVWSEVRVNSAVLSLATESASLNLDTDPSGVDSFLNDSSKLSLAATYSTSPTFTYVSPGERTTLNGLETSYAATPILSSALPFGSTYIFQIERLSSSADRFSLFAETGPHAGGGINIALVGSETLNQIDTSADMYVSLQGDNISTTFFSVTINNPIGQDQQFVVLPEPGTALPLGLAAMALLFYRRRIAESAAN